MTSGRSRGVGIGATTVYSLYDTKSLLPKDAIQNLSQDMAQLNNALEQLPGGENTSTEEEDKKKKMMIIGGIGAAVVVAGVVVIAMKKKK